MKATTNKLRTRTALSVPWRHLHPYLGIHTTSSASATPFSRTHCTDRTPSESNAQQSRLLFRKQKMMRASGMVGIGLLALSFPQQAGASTVKQRQRAACNGMRSGEGCNYYISRKKIRGNCGMDALGDNCCNPVVCPDGSSLCGEPHMQGLRGQHINWSGVDGGWYCLVKDQDADFHVNVLLTAPQPVEFPDRQLVTGLSVISDGNALVVEVKDPYTTTTTGCAGGESVCLANNGLRVSVNGQETNELLVPSRDAFVADGIEMSASNLPVECRQFGGDKLWARMYAEMLQGERELAAETFEDWVLSFGQMAAPEWCAKYIAEHGLSEVQSIHAIFKIMTPTVDLRLNAGFGYQVGGEINWDGRVLPELEFWQMDVGMDGLAVDNEHLSGILGETARPVVDENGAEVMEGYGAMRGSVQDYRVSGALGTDFALLD